ncbi:MAG: bifunctional nuclease family protein [Acidimicrobiales bacterium]
MDPLLDDARDDATGTIDQAPAALAEEALGEAPASGASVESDRAVAADAGHYRVMSVETVVFDLSDPSPHVHLMEQELPYRSLSIPVALPDAQAIHAALENVRGRRPTTHELLCEIVARLRCDVVAARIVRLDQGVYHAQLDLMTPRGVMHVDCRTSDALVVALRQPVVAPILCAEEVLEAVQS